MSLKDKINIFNKPKVDEEELRKQQIKKASFNAKLSKFETGISAKENRSRQATESQKKAKIFEAGAIPEAEREAQERSEKERKEKFATTQRIFSDGDGAKSGSEDDEQSVVDGAQAKTSIVSLTKAMFEQSQGDDGPKDGDAEDSDPVDEKDSDLKQDADRDPDPEKEEDEEKLRKESFQLNKKMFEELAIYQRISTKAVLFL